MQKGISELIGSVLAFLFGIIMLTVAIQVLNPTFQRAQDTTVITDALSNLDVIDSAIQQVASEAEGSKRTVSISVSDGTYRTDDSYDWIYFEYEPKQSLSMSGTQGDITVNRDLKFMDYFNWYVDGVKSPLWTNTSGTWAVSSYKYSGTNGFAYANMSESVENWKFSGSIENVTGPTGGQIFVLPVNPERLVGYWVFDNSSGTTAYDYSGNANHGTLTSMASPSTEYSGWQNSSVCKAGRSCLAFDGVNDYISVGDSATLDITTGTWSTWVYPKAWETDRTNNYIIDKFHVYMLYVKSTGDDAGKVSGNVALVGGNGKAAITEEKIPLNQWSHLAVSWDGATLTVYINGVEKATNNEFPGIIDNGGTLYIGEYPGTGYQFNGIIDEVMVFNVSLSATEVASLYETSAKKLDESGSKSIASQSLTPAIVVSNPSGQTKFDNIIVSGGKKDMDLVITYTNVDINGTLRLSQGSHQVEIRHMGTNATSSRPIIQVTKA